MKKVSGKKERDAREAEKERKLAKEVQASREKAAEEDDEDDKNPVDLLKDEDNEDVIF